MRLIGFLAAILACQGCIINVNRDRTIGQELIELHQARVAGTISEADYLSRRAEVFSEAPAQVHQTSMLP